MAGPASFPGSSSSACLRLTSSHDARQPLAETRPSPLCSCPAPFTPISSKQGDPSNSAVARWEALLTEKALC